jgi:hypothetical protein
MMFTLAVIYEIPELNLGIHFYMRSDEEDDEKERLKDTSGNNYTDLDKENEAAAPEEADRP